MSFPGESKLCFTILWCGNGKAGICNINGCKPFCLSSSLYSNWSMARTAAAGGGSLCLGLINLPPPPFALFAGCMGLLRAVGLCYKPKVVCGCSCHLPALRLPGHPSFPAAICAPRSDPRSSTELTSEGEAPWEQPDGLVPASGHVPWSAPCMGRTCWISSWRRQGCGGSSSSLEEAAEQTSPSQCSGSPVGALAGVI